MIDPFRILSELGTLRAYAYEKEFNTELWDSVEKQVRDLVLEYNRLWKIRDEIRQTVAPDEMR